MGKKKHQPEVDYQTIVETVPAIVFVAGTGLDGPWYYVSDWIEPILGFTVAEGTGNDVWARQSHPDDRDHVVGVEAKEVEAALASEDPASGQPRGTFYLDYRMLHRDGHVVWIRDNSWLG